MPRSNAPYYHMQGYSRLGSGIRDAADSIAGVITDRKKQKKEEFDGLEMMKGVKTVLKNAPELQEMMGIEDIDDLSPNAWKGAMQAMTAKAAMMDNLFKPHFETDAEGNRIFMQSPKSGFPVQEAKYVDAGTGPQMSQDGRFYMSPGDGTWKPVPAGGSAQGPKVSAYELKKHTQRRMEILDEIDTLQKEVSGGNKKAGPDWGWGSKYADRIKELEREMAGIDAVLDGGTSTGGGAQAAPGAPGAGKAPRMGEVVEGYRFLGGDPSDENNWAEEK